MAIDLEHSMKHTRAGVIHSQHEHASEHGKLGNNLSSSGEDLEKHASHGAGYDTSHIPKVDGDYVVTAKTWAVVVVS